MIQIVNVENLGEDPFWLEKTWLATLAETFSKSETCSLVRLFFASCYVLSFASLQPSVVVLMYFNRQSV